MSPRNYRRGIPGSIIGVLFGLMSLLALAGPSLEHATTGLFAFALAAYLLWSANSWLGYPVGGKRLSDLQGQNLSAYRHKFFWFMGTALATYALLYGIVLGLAGQTSARFTATKSGNPYVMFDTKTAQACWSGPDEVAAQFPNITDKRWFYRPSDGNTIDDFIKAERKRSSNGLPFCADLKAGIRP